MSLFSGFILGQATACNGNAGEGAAAILGIFAFVAIVISIAITIVAFFFPVIAIAHLTIWSLETNFLAGSGTFLIPLLLLVSVPLSYVFALFGDKSRAIGAIAFMALIDILAVVSVSQTKDSPFLQYEALSDPKESINGAIIIVALGIGCTIAIRFLILRMMSGERKDRIYSKFTSAYLSAYNSKTFAWFCIVTTAAFAIGTGAYLSSTYNQVAWFVENNGRDALQTRIGSIYAENYNDSIMLAVVAAVLLIGSIFFFFAKKKQEKR